MAKKKTRAEIEAEQARADANAAHLWTLAERAQAELDRRKQRESRP